MGTRLLFCLPKMFASVCRKIRAVEWHRMIGEAYVLTGADKDPLPLTPIYLPPLTPPWARLGNY